MVLTKATGDAELVLWDGREFGHWFYRSHTQFSFVYQSLKRRAQEFSCLIHVTTSKPNHVVKTLSILQRILMILISLLLAILSQG